MDSFVEMKENEQYMALAQDLRAIAVERKQDAAISLIDRALGEFSKGTFSLAVLGMVKRGKSTLCNALLGADCEKYAPVGKTPVSNAISVFEKGEDSVSVEYLDGHREYVTIEDIPQFITEQLNPGNRKNVSCLHIKSAFPRLPEGVSLVDTPGEGSFHAHHDDILYKYLPSVDAAIFLIDVFAPLTESELDFLKEIMGNDVKKLFFAMNRIDRADQDEIDAAIEHNLKALADIGLNVSKIYPISAKNALNGDWESSGLLVLFSDVEKFLSVEKFRIPRRRFMNRVAPVISPLEEGIKTEIEARTKTAEELRQEIDNLTERGESLECSQNDELTRFKSKWDDAETLFYSDLKGSLSELQNIYMAKVNNMGVFNIRKSREEFVASFDGSVRAAFNSLISQFNQCVNEALAELPVRYAGLDDANNISGVGVSFENGTTFSRWRYAVIGIGVVSPIVGILGYFFAKSRVGDIKNQLCAQLPVTIQSLRDFWEGQRDMFKAERDNLITSISEQFRLQMSPTVQALQDALESQGKIDVQYDERLKMLESLIGSIRERANGLNAGLEG